MQKFTRKYCLVSFIEQAEEGFEYSWTEWPLHITITDVFAIPMDSKKLTNQLVGLLEKQQPVTIKAAEDDYFGQEKQVQVTLINMSKELITLHKNVIISLKDAGAVFNDPRYIEDGYKAHVTVQSHSRVNTGDSISIKQISLIDMFPNNDGYKRKVLKTFTLDQD